MPLAYTMFEGGEWHIAYPYIPDNWSAILYEDGWVYDRVLEKYKHLSSEFPWRRF